MIIQVRTMPRIFLTREVLLSTTIIMMLLLTSCKKEGIPASIEKGLLLNQTINAGGRERAYHLFVPEVNDNAPLVVLLHGNSGSHDQVLGLDGNESPSKVWLTLAEENNFMVLVPNGTIGPSGKRGWNDCRVDAKGQTDADDVLFIKTLLELLKTDYSYNGNKVYVSGISNGGFMTSRLVMEIPEKIAAFAAVISSMPVNTACPEATIPISALFMNGTDDPIVPYNGGEMAAERGLIFSTVESIDYWRQRNGIVGQPEEKIFPDNEKNDDCSVLRYYYKNGTNNTEVALYTIMNGGHAEPSMQERYGNIFLQIVGNQNADIEMAKEIWGFFEDKSK